MWYGVNLQRNNFTLKKKLDPILICFEALREIKSLNFWWKSIKFVILQFSVLLNSLNLNEKFCSLFITPGPIHFCFSQNNIPEEPVAYSRCHICTLYFALFHSTLCQNVRKIDNKNIIVEIEVVFKIISVTNSSVSKSAYRALTV